MKILIYYMEISENISIILSDIKYTISDIQTRFRLTKRLTGDEKITGSIPVRGSEFRSLSLEACCACAFIFTTYHYQ